MNFVKRAFRNVIYKKGYNFLLILLFTVLATLILSGFSISSASSQACASVRRNLGGAVTMRNANLTSGVPIDTAKSISGNSHAKSSNFICKGEAYAYDFKAISDPLSGLNGKLKKVTADIGTVGVSQTNLLTSFTNGTNKLEKGRGLSQKDVGTTNAVVEVALANQDNLQPGSKITLLSTVDNKTTITFTVVGIYQNTSQNVTTGGAVSENGNRIYIPYTAAEQISGSADKIDYAIYYMDDPINIDSFKSKAFKILKSGYTLDAQDADYRRMAGSLSSLTFLSSALVYGILIVGVAILSLIVMLSLKDRKYEIGVLLSIGEKKVKIITQLAIEIIVPIIIAFSVSIATGSVAAQQIGNVMLQTEKQVQQSMSADDSKSEVKDYTTGKTLSTEQKIDVKVSGKEILLLYSDGILIALLSAIAPMIFVLRYSPKKILIDIE